jgi:hypothetical protein
MVVVMALPAAFVPVETTTTEDPTVTVAVAAPPAMAGERVSSRACSLPLWHAIKLTVADLLAIGNDSVLVSVCWARLESAVTDSVAKVDVLAETGNIGRAASKLWGFGEHVVDAGTLCECE